MKKIWIWWIVAILATMGSVYRYAKGPTMPLKQTVELSGGERKTFRLPRSGSSESVRVAVPMQNVSAYSGASVAKAENAVAVLYFKPYPEQVAGEPYKTREMYANNGQWEAWLPALPPAEQWQYYVEAEGKKYPAEEPALVVFKGEVPWYYQGPHLFFMFLTVLLITMAGGLSFMGMETYKNYLYTSLISLLLGGVVFGCLVHHAAFGSYWGGFPTGNDPAANKTIVMLLVLLVSFGLEAFAKKWQGRRWAAVAAMLVAWVLMLI